MAGFDACCVAGAAYACSPKLHTPGERGTRTADLGDDNTLATTASAWQVTSADTVSNGR